MRKFFDKIWPFLIFLLALVARIYFIYFVSEPENAGVGWYGDTYHHWQIAYLTKEIGLKRSFLRLWDLKGMEYYWGPLHPLLLTLAFSLTGSTNIVITRIFSAVFGSFVCLFFYLLGKRNFNFQVGLATGLLAAILPMAILNDASGSLEPLGYALLLYGLYLWPRLPFLVGVSLGLASTARAEAWLLSGILVAGSFWKRRNFDKFVLMFAGWAGMIFLYMKYLLDKTSNALYPLWWNFLANAIGKWGYQGRILSFEQEQARMILGIWFVVSLVLLFLTFIKRPKGYLFFLFGFSVWAFVSGFIGLTAYIAGYQSWFWMIRFFVVPYIFAGFLIIWVLLDWLPRHLAFFGQLKLGWLVVILMLVLLQVLWTPIMAKYETTQSGWESDVKQAEEIVKYYRGGGILFPEGESDLLYALVRTGKVEGKNIVGQMFDPFYYPPFSEYDDYFISWEEDRELVLKFLKKEKIKFLVTYQGRKRYLELIKREPQLFEFSGEVAKYLLYQVKTEEIK